MTPVFPYLIRRSQDGWRGELLLRLRSGKSAYVVQLSLEQARMLAVEMRGLASDHCPLHHMVVRLVESLNAEISHIIIKRVGQTDEVAGLVRMATPSELQTTQVDAAAALSLAIHMGLPIFMDGQFSHLETEEQYVSRHGPSPAGGASSSEPADFPSRVPTPPTIPQAFQELIEGLKMPESLDSSDSWPDAVDEP